MWGIIKNQAIRNSKPSDNVPLQELYYLIIVDNF